MPSHASSDTGNLLVIKASAGSGKTHRLTGEYLRLLFTSENRYKHILAVTFTNKATEEMKSRIVKELYKLSAGEESDYLENLAEKFCLTETQLREKAKTVLENILHNYSAFSINTIDRFFQQTMRAFTREMGISGGYRLEMNESLTLTQIIDLMIFELDKPQNKELAGWILNYMHHQIEDGKSWNIKENIGKLAQQLFNEKYKLLSMDEKIKTEDRNQLADYRQRLVKIVKTWENEVKAVGIRALNLMAKFNLTPTDFKYGKASGFLSFTKIADGDFRTPSGRFLNRADNREDWSTADSDKKPAIEAAYLEGLNDCVKQVIRLFENNLHYNTAKNILQNYYTLGILNDIRNRLRLFQREKNILFLSDTTELLNRIIADSESPFIYEKTGTRVVNYMIDEFQDTSAMQWQNFKPLISESLAHGNFNLIVGDVKQSIYRWRNSDWGLLETQIPVDFRNNALRNETLDTNWRSDTNIVAFNNAVFQIAAEILQEDFNRSSNLGAGADRKILDAYQHVFQLIPPGKNENGGHVKISFLDASARENNWKEQALEQLPKEIESLQDQGFALKDIAILVRKNDEAVEVAEKLLKYKEQHPESKYRYDIISNEALVIGNAQSVKAAIAMLRYFQSPQNNTRRMLAVYEYNRFHRNLQPEKAISNYFDTETKDFPEKIKTELNAISALPFYEMTEAFFAMNKESVGKKENAYVQAFLDIVLKFSTELSSNANDFLDWWDEKGNEKTLFSPNDQDAIRLMTIHKSKGLGFGAVILPFLKWDIDHSPGKGPILWCKPAVEPFNSLGILPLEYKKSLADTIFKTDYLREKLYTYIDNLNLLYVAFTRAKHRITAFAPKPVKNSAEDVSALLWQTFQRNRRNQTDFPLYNYLNEEGNRFIFELGNPASPGIKVEKKTTLRLDPDKWHSIPFNDRLKLRLNSIGFFSDNGSRSHGTLMHEIISGIQTMDDLEDAVEKKYISGEIDANEKDRITTLLTRILSNKEVADWYSGKYHVVNETLVLHPSLGFSRPDRVMIGTDGVIVVDYKFGDAEDEKYNRQVRHYVRLIQEMGYDTVKGFVFYVKLGKVREV